MDTNRRDSRDRHAHQSGIRVNTVLRGLWRTADRPSAIESKTHGNVLWAPLDHGATRIGYAYTPEIAARYPDGVTQEVAEREAIRAMAPFHVRFTEVHWWTL